MDRSSRAAAVLLDGFESVLGSKIGLFALPDRKLSQQDADALNAPYAYLIEGVKAADRQAAAEMLQRTEAVLVGAKDFEAPKGLGGVRSRFCYVVILVERSGFDLSKYFRGQPPKSSDPTQVWKWQAPLFEEPPSTATLYAAQVEDSYLLVSNSLDDLQSVSRRLSGPEGKSAALRSLRGWDSVSKREFWAYRRYRRGPMVDPVAAGIEGIPEDAEALILFLDPTTKSAVLRLLGSARAAAGSKSVDIMGLPLLAPLEPGIWEARIPLSGDEQTLERLSIVIGMFGFGLYP